MSVPSHLGKLSLSLSGWSLGAPTTALAGLFRSQPWHFTCRPWRERGSLFSLDVSCEGNKSGRWSHALSFGIVWEKEARAHQRQRRPGFSLGTCFFLLLLGLEQAEAPARPGHGSFAPAAGSAPLAARPSPRRSAALTSGSTPRLTASLGPCHTLPEQVETRSEGDPQGGSRRVPKPGPGSPQQTPGRGSAGGPAQGQVQRAKRTRLTLRLARARPHSPDTAAASPGALPQPPFPTPLIGPQLLTADRFALPTRSRAHRSAFWGSSRSGLCISQPNGSAPRHAPAPRRLSGPSS